MNTTIRMAALGGLATLAMTSAAQAALQGRDLDGSLATHEAYYDTVLDITWLADANYAKTSSYDADGAMTWVDANTWAANLSFYNPLTNQTYDDWRLPTVDPINGSTFNYNVSFNGSTDFGYNITSPQSEMAYMYYVNLGNPSFTTPAGASSGCYVNSSNTCLDNVGPFVNLQPYVYWSATEYAPSPANAWLFTMHQGAQDRYGKTSSFYAWAVSPGDVAAVPEAETYALMLAGLGLIAWRARRRG